MQRKETIPGNGKKKLTRAQWVIGSGFWLLIGVGAVTMCSSISTETGFDEPAAVVNCDYVMEQAAVDKPSFYTELAWTTMRGEDGKTATIQRNFNAKNAMGGNLSGTYRCVVSTADASVQSLDTTDAFGAHKIM